MFTLLQKIFMDTAAILSTIRIALLVAVTAVHTSTAVSHLHKAPSGSVRWSLCCGFHYVRNVEQQSFVWNVVCDCT